MLFFYVYLYIIYKRNQILTYGAYRVPVSTLHIRTTKKIFASDFLDIVVENGSRSRLKKLQLI